jgi:hypothetical protein
VTNQKPSRRRLWRMLAASALPVQVALWALWSHLYELEAEGLRHVGGGTELRQWELLSGATVLVVLLLWAPLRSLRVVASTFHALLVSIACGVAAVLGVMHAFGGPGGDLSAPTWGLAALGVAEAWGVASLLATGALVVEEVRRGDAEEEHQYQDPDRR